MIYEYIIIIGQLNKVKRSDMKRQITDDDSQLPLLKIVIVGESGVGKTNIVSRYAYDKFNIGSNTTIGIEFVSRVVVVEQEEVCLQIWDTAGQDRFRALNRSFYRNAKGAIVVFSVGDGHGFRNLKKWIVELKEHANENLVMILVGNKSDIKQREVSVSEANLLAMQQKMAYIETSAALNINIDKVFEMLSGKIYQIYKQKNQKKSKKGQILSVIENNKKDKKTKCCQ